MHQHAKAGPQVTETSSGEAAPVLMSCFDDRAKLFMIVVFLTFTVPHDCDVYHPQIYVWAE